MAGSQQVQRTGTGVHLVVLIVAVHGHHTKLIRPVNQKIIECGFQRRTLAPVHRVVQQGDFRMRRGSVRKVMQIFRLGAVIDQDNILKAHFQQTVDDRCQLFIGIQGGQYNRDFCQILHIIHLL